ncbi:NADase-type glycan-binding domain-containing protein [Streptomyces sp. NPDC102402]|uniref:NADase-type glycan-binding domain-containing protein n=1 Tax=Streptomyces sp. NPDC102402 TaxID=3366169 RepID=UPI0037F8AE72
MRACPACGASNGSTDDFCGNCGAYLGWSDRSAPSGTSSEPPPPSTSADPSSSTPAEPSAPGTSSGPSVPGTSSAPSATGAPGPTASEPPAPGAHAEPPAAPHVPPPDAARPAAAPAPPPAEEPASPPATAPASPPAEGPGSAERGRGSSLRSRLTGRGRGEAHRTGTAPAAGSRGNDSEGSGTASEQGGTPGPVPRPGPDGAGSAPSAPAFRPTTGSASRAGEPAVTGEAATARAPHPVPTPPPAPVPGNPPGPRPPATPASDPSAPAPIQPVRPAKPVARRPVVRPVEAPDEVAGAPCPSCGTPNPPGRRFCRRCAAELNPAAKPEPLPWWRRVWPFRRRVRASSGRAVRFLVILAVVVALCAGALLLLPAGRALFEDTRDKLGKAKPITPLSIEASAASPRHPAKNTTDGLSNSYWGAPAAGASVTYTFRKPFRLVDLIITNGPSKEPEDYTSEARALRIDLEVTTRDGEQRHKELALSDKPGPQTIHTALSDVKTVRLTLREPVELTPGRQLALAEVEFFQRG